MSFADPLLLLSLLVVPAAAGFYVLAQRRGARYAVDFTNLDVLSQVVGRAWRRHIPTALLGTALLLLCVAVARPQVRTIVTTKGTTVILVVDASLSMYATDVKPSRLGAAQAAVHSFLDRVPARVRVGLVSFSGEAEVGAPPTADRGLVRESVDSIGSSGAFGGTAIGDALALAVDLAGRSAGKSSGPAGGARPSTSILFLSDGRQNQGVVAPLEGARRAKEAGMRVYTIALGTDHGRLPAHVETIATGTAGRGFDSRLLGPDPETLKRISEITGGQFFRAESAEALQSAYATLGTRLAGKPGQREITYVFLGAAAALLLTAAAFSAFWVPRLP
jgi:Ca-activated chloride channel homolog